MGVWGHRRTGVFLQGGTLIDAGTIAAGAAGASNGTAGLAVQFGSLAGLLVVDRGASFIGNVVAGTGATDILELSGSSTKALTGIGTNFLGFSEIDFAAGAGWAIEVTTAGLATGETITGFTLGDTIILDSSTETSASFSDGHLVLNGTSTLDLAGSFSTSSFTFTQSGGNTTLALGTSSTGPGSPGIRGDHSTIDNAGIIIGGIGPSSGQATTGISVSYSTIVNTGSILAGNTAQNGAGNGIDLDHGVVQNAGLIAGGNAGGNDAVDFTGAGTLIVDPGARFIGKVVGGGSLLELSGASPAALTGIGTQFLDFQDISFASGAAWALEGNAAGLASGEVISGFAAADTIILDGFAATSESFISGTGLILGNATVSEMIGVTSPLDHLSVTSDSANTTLSVFCF